MKQGNQRVTLKDIAAKTGFSVNTVSKSLRDMPDISLQTREFIRQTAKQMGYVSNELASSLRRGSSHVIALIIGDISNPFFGIICKEIEQQASRQNYTVIVLNTEEDEEREFNAIRTAIAKNVDGIILAPSQHRTDNIEFIRHAGVPFVLLGRCFDDSPADCVLFDDVNGGYLAGRHLLSRGCRRLLMLNAPDNSSARDRAVGFRQAMEQSPDAESRILTISALGGLDAAVREMYAAYPFDAVFAFSDLLAMETVCVLQKLGLPQIPVVGFDDIQSRFAIPYPLTSVSSDKSAFAAQLVALLLRRIGGNTDDYPSRIIVPTSLSVRAPSVPESAPRCMKKTEL